MYADMYAALKAQLVFGCPSLSSKNSQKAINTRVLAGLWLSLSDDDLEGKIGVGDDSKSASLVDFIDKIAITHTFKILICT